MRLQLTGLLLVLSCATAYADGTLSMRGVYYKERSTRVMQPMLDGMFDAGAHGTITGHLLVDAITSASASSGAASAAFTENRYEAGLGYTHEIDGPENSSLDLVRVGADAKYSPESDYTSLYGGVRAEAELAQKNAVVGIGGGVSKDTVSNAGAQGPMGGPLLLCDNTQMTASETECPLDTYSLFSSASQLLGDNALIGLTYDLVKMHGFTSNAYRQVITGTGPVAEKHPNDRLREAIALSGRYYVPRTRTAFIAAYRFYWDDWKIRAHTPELRVVQEVGQTIDASLRYRYYTQTAAFFWEKRYPDASMVEYLTDDPKMSPFDGHVIEAKLGLLGETFDLGGRWAGTRFEGILEYIVQHNRFGNAVVAHVAITVPFDY